MSIIGWLPLVASAYLLDELSRPCGLSKLRGAPSRWRWGGCEIHSPVSGRLPTPQAAPQVIHQIFVLSAVRDAYTNTCDFCGPSLSDSEVGSREKSWRVSPPAASAVCWVYALRLPQLEAGWLCWQHSDGQTQLMPFIVTCEKGCKLRQRIVFSLFEEEGFHLPAVICGSPGGSWCAQTFSSPSSIFGHQICEAIV